MSIPDAEAAPAALGRDDLAHLRAALEAAPLARALGIEYTDLRPGHAAATLSPGGLLPDYRRRAHAGALFTLAEQTMNAAANSLGKLGVPLSCEIDFLVGALPDAAISAHAWVVDTQDHIARVVVELSQQGAPVARLTERVFLRPGTA
jgi:acyl-coenzyme A thioesterase PaaI-like protein